MYHLLYHSMTLHFVFVGFVLFLAQTGISFLINVNELIAVMVFSLRYRLNSKALFRRASTSKG
jgi:hypothetical protein